MHATFGGLDTFMPLSLNVVIFWFSVRISIDRNLNLTITASEISNTYMNILMMIQQYPRDLALHLEDDQGVYQIECLIFEAEQQGIRALFKHGSFELAERLLHFIACQQEAMTLA